MSEPWQIIKSQTVEPTTMLYIKNTLHIIQFTQKTLLSVLLPLLVKLVYKQQQSKLKTTANLYDTKLVSSCSQTLMHQFTTDEHWKRCDQKDKSCCRGLSAYKQLATEYTVSNKKDK